MKHMTYYEARDYVNAEIPCTDYLKPSPEAGRGFYCCPDCGSGERKGGTGAAHMIPGTNLCKCFSCGKTFNAAQLHALTRGVDFKTAVYEMAGSLGLSIDERQDGARSYSGQESGAAPSLTAPQSPQKTPQNSAQTPPVQEHTQGGQKPEKGQNGAQEPPKDYREYCTQCARILWDDVKGKPGRDYLAARGISMETARAYRLGFDPQADPAGAGHPVPRLIIPLAGDVYTYQARAISDTGLKAQYRKMNPKGSRLYPFNEKILWEPDIGGDCPVFVTEGPFDALSFLEIGWHAMALNGAGNVKRLLATLEKEKTGVTLIVCLDTDGPGQKAAQELRQGLDRLNVSHVFCDLKEYTDAKDANEFLTQDRAGFIAAAQKEAMKAKTRPDGISLYMDTLMATDMQNFRQAIPTGYANLDKLTGGLYSGLYVLAAISSLGKTTFAHQMADQIAKSGTDVLFFSLEQSRLELVSKSIAREMASRPGGPLLTSLQIRRGQGGQSVINAAAAYQREIGDRLSIIEGNFLMTCDRVEDYIRQYIRRTGTRPVVFIDYLQILDPGLDATGRPLPLRESIDKTVQKLKRLSRGLGLTVFVISSVNRANYLTPISFESLKESGGIEYSSDAVWGMQLEVLSRDEKTFDRDGGVTTKRKAVDEAKEKIPREIELVILKNRYGRTNQKASLRYYPDRDLFEEWTGRRGLRA